MPVGKEKINQSNKRVSFFARWWWGVDRIIIYGVFLLILCGVFLCFSASPCVATRIGFQRFFFVKRHLLMIPLSIFFMIAFSIVEKEKLKKISFYFVIFGFFSLIILFFLGKNIKGAVRWFSFFGFSLQPSEFIKPFVSVWVGYLISEKAKNDSFRAVSISSVIIFIFSSLLIIQPDLGMTFTILLTYLLQLFIGGMPIIFVIISLFVALFGLIFAYIFLPHVTKRIDSFLNITSLMEFNNEDLYQIKQSLMAFRNGGWLGVGPGEGVVKKLVPDAHADFIFPIAAEEFGFLFCFFIIILFIIIIQKSFIFAKKSNDIFSIITIVGLVSQFGIQAFINIASSLCIIPTKGMTMPFISYGGSSMIATGITVGIILSLTKKEKNKEMSNYNVHYFK